MSEETNQEQKVHEETQDKECTCACCKKLYALVLATLIFAIAGFVLGAVNLLRTPNIHDASEKPAQAQQNKKAVVISKQYDKGQSLEKALATKKPVIVFFYTDWCGFCQRFAPTFYKVTKTKDIKKNFAVAYVNCENAENRQHMQEFNVEGFPTVYVIDKDNQKTHLENGTFFTPDAEKELPKIIMNLLK